MPEPTQKTDGINEFIKAVFGIDRVDIIKQGACIRPPIGCGRENVGEDFRDEVSEREYRISGLCQRCQDKIFNEAD